MVRPRYPLYYAIRKPIRRASGSAKFQDVLERSAKSASNFSFADPEFHHALDPTAAPQSLSGRSIL